MGRENGPEDSSPESIRMTIHSREQPSEARSRKGITSTFDAPTMQGSDWLGRGRCSFFVASWYTDGDKMRHAGRTADSSLLLCAACGEWFELPWDVEVD